jgi:hypothetical protein
MDGKALRWDTGRCRHQPLLGEQLVGCSFQLRQHLGGNLDALLHRQCLQFLLRSTDGVFLRQAVGLALVQRMRQRYPQVRLQAAAARTERLAGRLLGIGDAECRSEAALPLSERRPQSRRFALQFLDGRLGGLDLNRLGRTLNFDPKTEQEMGDAEANRMLRGVDRGCRKPCVIPEKV